VIDFVVGAVPLRLVDSVVCSLHHCDNRTCNCFSNPEWFGPDSVECSSGFKFDTFSVVAVCDDCLSMLEKDTQEVFVKARALFESPTQYVLDE